MKRLVPLLVLLFVGLVGAPAAVAQPSPDTSVKPVPGSASANPNTLNPADPNSLPAGAHKARSGISTAAALEGCGATKLYAGIYYQICNYPTTQNGTPVFWYILWVYNAHPYSVSLPYQTATVRDGHFSIGPIKGPTVVYGQTQVALTSSYTNYSGCGVIQVTGKIKANGAWSSWAYGQTYPCP